MGNGIELKNNYGIHAKPEHFDKAFNLCVNNKFTKQQALIIANGFNKRGLIDASEGCMHYVLRLM
ncbi:MAG: hypothetical protein WCX73_06005 [Candidatus Pacearchaeota archaeon]|jgi:hypothetical protein